jgi:hypothetical protein
MLKIKKGNKGIRINVTHDAGSIPVYYKIDGGAEAQLVSNSYFILNADNTATTGTHEVEFTAKDATAEVTSNNIYRYTVYE